MANRPSPNWQVFYHSKSPCRTWGVKNATDPTLPLQGEIGGPIFCPRRSLGRCQRSGLGGFPACGAWRTGSQSVELLGGNEVDTEIAVPWGSTTNKGGDIYHP